MRNVTLQTRRTTPAAEIRPMYRTDRPACGGGGVWSADSKYGPRYDGAHDNRTSDGGLLNAGKNHRRIRRCQRRWTKTGNSASHCLFSPKRFEKREGNRGQSPLRNHGWQSGLHPKPTRRHAIHDRRNGILHSTDVIFPDRSGNCLPHLQTRSRTPASEIRHMYRTDRPACGRDGVWSSLVA